MRRKTGRYLTAILAALAAALPLAPGRAAESTPLPAFEVKNAEGQAVQSDRLSTKEQWLLVYVQPNCRPCAELFRAFQKKDETASLGDRVVVVVGDGTVEEAREMARRTPWIPQSSWYADPSKSAAEALKVKGAPVVFGVRQGHIEWDMSGVLQDEKSLKSILESWGAPPPAPAP